MITITTYRGLYVTTPTGTLDFEWLDLASWLSNSTEAMDKFSVHGFGLHTLTGSDATRNLAAVVKATSIGFDVDAGTPDEVAASLGLLRAAGQSTIVYSSHSHAPEKPALRFIVECSRAMRPEEFPYLRAHLITKFKIPCKPEQSADVSRFWFCPSHRPGRTPVFEVIAGKPFDVDLVPAFSVRTPRAAPKLPDGWAPPPEPTKPVNVTKYRLRLEKRAAKYFRVGDSRRGTTLERLLAGEALAPAGERNNATLSACGIVAWSLGDGVPLSVLMLFMRPSLAAMQAQGSKLTEEKVERMLLTAMEKRAAEQADMNDFVEKCRRQKAAFEEVIQSSVGKESK